MPRFYCDYCDAYLTHDSARVRKQHNSGFKHKANVRAYYRVFFDQFIEHEERIEREQSEKQQGVNAQYQTMMMQPQPMMMHQPPPGPRGVGPMGGPMGGPGAR